VTDSIVERPLNKDDVLSQSNTISLRGQSEKGEVFPTDGQPFTITVFNAVQLLNVAPIYSTFSVNVIVLTVEKSKEFGTVLLSNITSFNFSQPKNASVPTELGKH
jgi:hypothetical protein